MLPFRRRRARKAATGSRAHQHRASLHARPPRRGGGGPSRLDPARNRFRRNRGTGPDRRGFKTLSGPCQAGAQPLPLRPLPPALAPAHRRHQRQPGVGVLGDALAGLPVDGENHVCVGAGVDSQGFPVVIAFSLGSIHLACAAAAPSTMQWRLPAFPARRGRRRGSAAAQRSPAPPHPTAWLTASAMGRSTTSAYELPPYCAVGSNWGLFGGGAGLGVCGLAGRGGSRAVRVSRLAGDRVGG